MFLGLAACAWTYFQPVPMYAPATKAFTPDEFKTFRADENRKMHRLREELDARRIFQRYGCDAALAGPTARYAEDVGLPARIIAADVVVESSCQEDIVSPKGAVGLMQIMPSIHHIDRRSLFDRETNLRNGSRILAEYARERGGIREGLRGYFGVTEGSTHSDEYADRVLAVAYGR